VKNKLFQKASSVWLGGLLALVLFAAAFSHAADNTGHFGIVGTWVTIATLSIIPPGFPPDGKFEAVETFYSDGTMNVVSQIPGVTIGAGVWKQTGPQRFTFTFTFYRPDPSSPTKMLAVLVNENVKMTGPDTYITTDTIVPLDAAGKPLFYFPGTVTATRYVFQDFNTLLP
jgi:hypothetical protein